MQQKHCRECKLLKPIEQFYKHAQMADGYLNKCIDCVKSRVRKHRRGNDSVRAYDRERAKTPKRKAHIRAAALKFRKDNPEKYKAHTAVNNAVRDGRLIKQPCEVCGDMKSHAHHNDYAKPFEVIWLCALHHQREHHK
jgi:hypothetical protein